MKSVAQTKYDKMIANKLTFLITLWVLDKLIMFLMLYWYK
jgi:hypothetical protein